MKFVGWVFFLLVSHCIMGIGFVSIEQNKCSPGFFPVSFWSSMEWNRSDSGVDFREDVDVKIAEENFSRFCQKVQGSQRPDYTLVPSKSSIPTTIHFIWLGSLPTPQVEKAVASWKMYHPGWKIEIWTDERVRDFAWSEKHLLSLFEEASTWAEKADILRLDILYQFGGIYSDIDVICLRSFHDVVIHDITFFSCFELNYTSRHYGAPFFVGTAVMGSSKGSKLMKYCLKHCKSEREFPGEGILKRTGPGLVSRACQALFGSSQEKILILPCSYLYPFPWMRRNEVPESFIAPESFAIHLWNYSWEF